MLSELCHHLLEVLPLILVAGASKCVTPGAVVDEEVKRFQFATLPGGKYYHRLLWWCGGGEAPEHTGSDAWVRGTVVHRYRCGRVRIQENTSKQYQTRQNFCVNLPPSKQRDFESKQLFCANTNSKRYFVVFQRLYSVELHVFRAVLAPQKKREGTFDERYKIFLGKNYKVQQHERAGILRMRQTCRPL